MVIPLTRVYNKCYIDSSTLSSHEIKSLELSRIFFSSEVRSVALCSHTLFALAGRNLRFP